MSRPAWCRVELARVAVVVVDHGAEQLLVAEARGHRSKGGPGPHPVEIPGDRVDLAVVAEGAERLGSLPGREGVRREPLVEDGERDLEAGVAEVEVEVAEEVGRDETLVDDRLRRAAHDVHAGDVAGDAPPYAVRGRFVHPLEQRLHDVWPRRDRLAPELGVVGRRGAPLDHAAPFRRDGRFDAGAGRGLVFADEEHRHAAVGSEDRGRDRKQDAGPVGGFAVRVQRAAMADVGETVERRGEDGRTRPARGVGDEADAAGVALLAHVWHSW
jgi:hypothetical protein